MLSCVTYLYHGALQACSNGRLYIATHHNTVQMQGGEHAATAQVRIVNARFSHSLVHWPTRHALSCSIAYV